jgi:hypothetical protein
MTDSFGSIENTFVETLGLLALTGGFNLTDEYHKGWFDGYARAYTQLTGNTEFVLLRKVNAVLAGSGKILERS